MAATEKKDFNEYRRRKTALSRKMELLENVLNGRNESFRALVTGKDGRLANGKIDAFVQRLLKNYQAYLAFWNKEALGQDQEELYRCFLYCAIAGYAWNSYLGDFPTYEISTTYADLCRMAELLGRCPMESREDLSDWTTTREVPDGDYIELIPAADDDFWAFMEDIFYRYDPETVAKREKEYADRIAREQKEAEERKKERQADAGATKGRIKLALVSDPEWMEQEEDSSEEPLPDDEEYAYDDIDPYRGWDDHWVMVAGPQFEAWEKQLPKKNLLTEKYKHFKDLYFDSRECDKYSIAKDITEMVDIFLFEEGISSCAFSDSFALVLDKIDQANEMVDRTVKRARVLGWRKV